MVDKFIAAHLYGAGGVEQLNLQDMSFNDLSALEESLLNISMTHSKEDIHNLIPRNEK